MAKFSAFFSEKNAHLLKILLYNPIFFLFPKFLELFFTPKNTPSKSKNSKLDKSPIFLGTPCRCASYSIYDNTYDKKINDCDIVAKHPSPCSILYIISYISSPLSRILTLIQQTFPIIICDALNYH